jgi:hypothetical protein
MKQPHSLHRAEDFSKSSQLAHVSIRDFVFSSDDKMTPLVMAVFSVATAVSLKLNKRLTGLLFTPRISQS